MFFPFELLAQQDTIVGDDTLRYFILYGHDRPENGYCDTCIIEEGTYKNDRKHGTWKHYYKSGSVRISGTYVNNYPNGTYTIYFENGRVKEIGTFSRNKYTGELLRYYQSGCLRYSGFYNDEGNEDGVQTYYHDNCDSTGLGQIEFIYTAKNGIPTSDSVVRYYSHGEIKEVIFYNPDGSMASKKDFLPSQPINENASEMPPSNEGTKEE